VALFPFGRPVTRRPPRVPTSGPAALFVLGVYPSALHVRWRRPDGVTIAALAVDDEPVVFWDGADAAQRVRLWQDAVGWPPRWGSVSAASANGSSGRHVVEQVLRPLRIAPETVHFTDYLPTYFVKSGARSQAAAIRDRYEPFAATQDPPLPWPRSPTRRACASSPDRTTAAPAPSPSRAVGWSGRR